MLYRVLMTRSLSAALVTTALGLAGCDESSAPGLERAGDGSQAYLKMAAAFCRRTIACGDKPGFGAVWASEESCAGEIVDGLGYGEQVTCSEGGDFTIDQKVLGACLAAIETLECEKLYEERSPLEKAKSGELADCRQAFELLARAEDEREGARAVGEPCNPRDRCVFGAYCDEKDAENCRVCRAEPKLGEACHVTSDGSRFCGVGAYCVAGKCRADRPQEGEACRDGETCAAGLDCGEDGRCQALFEVGDACPNGLSSSCGDWLECHDGKCQREDVLGQVGAPCDPETSQCVRSFCSKGKCTAYGALDATCRDDFQCLRPYACVQGKCADVPSCQAGKRGDPCTGGDQCGEGLDCHAASDIDEPSRCEPARGDLGEACFEEDECFEGVCVKGMCQLAGLGDTCDSPRDCKSGTCDEAGQCVESMCE